MSIFDNRFALLAIPVALGLGIAGANANPAGAGGPVQCRIETRTDGGMVAFRGTLGATADLGGSYAFRIAGTGPGGGSDIRQTGTFTVKAGEEIHLGEAALSAGGQYDVHFEVTANGRTYACN